MLDQVQDLLVQWVGEVFKDVAVFRVEDACSLGEVVSLLECEKGYGNKGE